MRFMSVLAATGAGAAVGWVCGRVPVWPGARLAAAAVIGSFVGSVGVVVFLFLTLNRSGSGGHPGWRGRSRHGVVDRARHGDL